MKTRSQQLASVVLLAIALLLGSFREEAQAGLGQIFAAITQAFGAPVQVQGRPANNDVLTYSSATGRWGAAAGGGGSTPDWNATLAVRATTSGQSPTISSGDTFTVANGATITAPGGAGSEHFGASSAAAGTDSLAFGNGASASGNDSAVVGQGASDAGNRLSVVVGQGSSTGGVAQVALGEGVTLGSGTGAVGIGQSVVVSGAHSVGIGIGVTIGGAQPAIVIGGASTSNGELNALVIGDTAQATGPNQVVLGSDTSDYKHFFLGRGVQSATPDALVGFHGTGGVGAGISGSGIRISSGVSGDNATASNPLFLALALPGTGTTLTNIVEVSGQGSVVTNATGSALATTATDQFLYLPTCAGVPTGTPTSFTGAAALVVDTSDARLYFYSGGWNQAGGGGGGSSLQAAYSYTPSGAITLSAAGGPLALTAPVNAFVDGLTITEANTNQAALLVTSQGTGISCPGSGSSSERFGAGARADGSSTCVFGNGAFDNSGPEQVIIGASATGAASGDQVIIGFSANGNGSNSIGIGNNSSIGNYSQVVLGAFATGGGGSHETVIGESASAAGTYSIVIGSGSSDNGADGSSLLGTGIYQGVNGVYSTVLGYGALNYAPECFIGGANATNTFASSDGCVILGSSAASDASISLVIGEYATARGFGSLSIGWESETSSTNQSVALGPRAFTRNDGDWVSGNLGREETNVFFGAGLQTPNTTTGAYTVHGSGGYYTPSITDPASPAGSTDDPGAGAFTAGTYGVEYTWIVDDGRGDLVAETLPSPLDSVTVGNGDGISVPDLSGSLPAGATGWSIYCETSPGSGVYRQVAYNQTGTYVVNEPDPSGVLPSGSNTTGTPGHGSAATFAGGDADPTSGASGNGADGVLRGGIASTAAQDGGSPRLRSALTGTGTTLHDRLVPSGHVTTLTDSSAVTFATVTCDSGSFASGNVHYTVFATSGSGPDTQCRSGDFKFSAVNVSGSITATVSTVSEAPLAASSVGTLVDTSSVTTGSGLINLQMSPVSSLPGPSEIIVYSVTVDSPSDVTPQ